MLQYYDYVHHKNFTFNTKEDFLNYIEGRMMKYWETHNNSFSRVCEALDSYDGFLGNNRVYPMDELDDILSDKKPSEVLQMIDTDNFNYNDHYFYYSIHGNYNHGIRSTDKKEYFNDVNYSEVFKKLVDNYGKIFNHRYDNAYYILFNDVDSINSQDEDKIQDDMNKGYYNYLFVDDNEFFWYGLLDNDL